MQQLSPLGTNDGPLSPCNTNPRVIETAAGTPDDPLSLHYHLALPGDVSNAFGEISRVPIFKMIREETPELFEAARLLYGQDTLVWFELDTPSDEPRPLPNTDCDNAALGEVAAAVLLDIQKKYRWILCVRGVHQGCPFGTLFFCLGVLAILRRLCKMFPTVKIPAIADDMTLVGPQLDCVAAFVEVKKLVLEIGLVVSSPKCKAICATKLHPETRRRIEAAGLSDYDGSFPSDGIILCGVPIGIDACAADYAPVAYEEVGVSAVVTKHKKTLEKIKRISNPQAKFLIARYCIAARNGHLFRCVSRPHLIRAGC